MCPNLGDLFSWFIFYCHHRYHDIFFYIIYLDANNVVPNQDHLLWPMLTSDVLEYLENKGFQ